MAGKDIIKMSQEEAKRLCVIQKALSREINQVKAAEILSLSDRQIRRIVKRVREKEVRNLGRQEVKKGFLSSQFPNLLTSRFY